MKKALYLTIVLFATLTIKLTAQETGSFPLGEKAKNVNHTGDVWLSELSHVDKVFNNQITVATFAPNAKLNWHTHPGGQILLVTKGIGYYQEKGKPVQVVREGDVVKCLPDVPHWHGSTPKDNFAYIGITMDSPKGRTKWLNEVTEQEYKSIQAPAASAGNAQQELIDLSKKKWTWMADRKTDSLNALFHEKSVFVHMGATMTKEQELNTIKSGGIHYKKADIHEASVNIIGNTAILLNRITLLAVVGGNEVTNPFTVTEVYQKENNSWKLASMSFTRLLTR